MSAFFWNVLLALAWMAMTGSMTPGNFALGIVIGFVALMVTSHVPGLPHYTRRGAAIVRLAFYTGLEIVLANLRVTRDLIRPTDIRPALVAFETRARGDYQVALLTTLIGLTPGTTVVDLTDDGRIFLVHFTNLPSGGPDGARQGLREGFERRLMEVFD